MSSSTMIRYEDLRPGDRIRVTRRVKVGQKTWVSTVTGTVESTERRRNGLHVDRSQDDKAFQDIILLRKEGAAEEESTLSMDEFTVIERA